MPLVESPPARLLHAAGALVRSARIVPGSMVAMIVLVGWLAPIYWVYLMSTVAISGLIALGVGLVTNRVGLISLCQMSFGAIGGWVTCRILVDAPSVWFPVAVVGGGLLAGAAGFGVGLASARVRGVEFAVVTLGFAAAVDIVVRQQGFPGVADGVAVVPTSPFEDPRAFYGLCWAMAIGAQLVLMAIGRTRPGRAWPLVRSSERAAAMLGVRVGRSKAGALGFGALCAGVAGGLLGGQYGLLTATVFSPLASMSVLVTAVLCGASLFSGAILAGAMGAFVPEALRRLGLPLDLGDGLLALGAFDVLRRGNGGLAEQFARWRQERAFRERSRTCELGADGVEAASAHAQSAGFDVAGFEKADFETAGHGPGLVVRSLAVDLGGVPILTGVDLDAPVGTVHALIGPNGAGKTVLIDAVCGFVRPKSGTVSLNGVALDELGVPERSDRGIARTFQTSRAPEDLTVGGYLHLASGSDGRAGNEPHRTRLTECFGLPDHDVPIRLMDIGSRRILEIAAALASRPSIVLLDEPAAGLDDVTSARLGEVVRAIPVVFGVGVLVVEHDLAFVRSVAEVVTVLDDGRVVATGSTSTVLGDRRVLAAYVGSAEEMRPEGQP